MNNTSDNQKAWRDWVEHWRFSNQTSYRISEELERLTTDWINHFKLPAETEPVILVRHPLLSIVEERNLRVNNKALVSARKRFALQQFTQSVTFGKLFSPESQVDAADVLEKNVGPLIKFITKNEKRLEVWKRLLAAVKNSGKSFLESEIDFVLLAEPKVWDKVEKEKLPTLIGGIYQIFIHTSHKGFLADNLNAWIFKQKPGMEGQSDPIHYAQGYLLVTKPAAPKLPEITEAWMITAGGASPESIPEGKTNRKEQRIEWITGATEEDFKNYLDLLLTLFAFCNESLSVEAKSTGLTQQIYHIVIPVFSWSLSQRSKDEGAQAQHRGGILLGWVFQRSLGKPAWWPEVDKPMKTTPSVMDLVSDLSLRLERFAEHYLSGETEWALEREWKPDDTAASYMKRNFFHSCGWDCMEIESKKMDSYFQWVEKEWILKVNLSRKLPTGRSSQSGSNSLVAHLMPNSLCIIPDDETAKTAYFTSVAEHVRYFYHDRCLAIEIQREALRKVGQQSGFLASAHDYSKDIGPILSQLSEYGEKIRSSMGTIQTEADKLSGLPAPAGEVRDRIKEELQELQAKPAPRFGWFAATRFLNAHLVTQTRGVLLPEPIECVKMLENGALGDLEEIVRILVWHPVTIQELKDRERKYNRWSPEKLRLSSTWWTLFSFDLDPAQASLPFREKLGQRVCSLVLDERIDQTAFAERFQVPRIKIVNDLDESVSSLWPDCDANRWRPLDGLLPLFVFSMRFAFQCVWAKTIIEEPKEPLAVRIMPSKPADRKNEFQITFPSLTSPGRPQEDHPYFREWDAQIAHYRGAPVWKSSPWKAVAGTTSVTHESWGDICQITLTAAI